MPSTKMRGLRPKESTLASKLATIGPNAQGLCSGALSLVRAVARSDHSNNANLVSIGPKAGSGRCAFRTVAGDYIAGTGTYAAARLISNGSPNVVVSFQVIEL